MSLIVVSTDDDGVALLDCSDDMNALAMCEEFTELKSLLGSDWAGKKVAIGFADVSYIDSAAIGWLLSLHKAMNEAGGKLVLHSMSPSVRRVLTMMRIDSTTPQMIDLADHTVEHAVHKAIKHAVEQKASDLMLLAHEDYYALNIRQLGVVRPLSIVSSELGKRFAQHIKAQSGMDVAEHRHPHDGRWIYDELTEEGAEQEDTTDHAVDLRISCVPTLHGEDMVIRLLSRATGLFDVNGIGLTKKELAAVKLMLDSPGGLILCCGPTGSGKTATLYAALDYLNDGSRKINTIEDPIEFAIDGLRQSQINNAVGIHFAELLRGVLRQSPDIIMIGEIRDHETATTAVHAANSGHIVLSTIHAPVAAAAVESMRSLGVNNHFLATALRGVISQRLVRTLDPERRVEYDISHAPQIFEPITHLFDETDGKKFYAPGASDGHTGYDGQTGIFEVMAMSSELRNMVSNGQDTNALRKQAHADGMLDFKSNALLKVAQGKTSIEEVFRFPASINPDNPRGTLRVTRYTVLTMIQRIPEPEVMDDIAEAAAYDAMDHTQPNTAFVERLVGLGIGQCKTVLDLGTGPGDIPILLCERLKPLPLRGGGREGVPSDPSLLPDQEGSTPSPSPSLQGGGLPTILAIDLAQSMLDLAQNKITQAGLDHRITLAKMDVKALDLPDNSFDAVFSNTILHHLPEPGAMLAEAARVLKPNGLLLIRDLYRPDSLEALNALVDEHAGDSDEAQRQLFADSLHAALTPEELRELADRHGLTDCEIVIDTDRHLSLQRGIA
eukprot:g12557.t1